MYARVNVIEASADQVDEGVSLIRDRVLPAVSSIDGFSGLIGLVDRDSGKTLGITLWESQEAMLASEQEAGRIRSEMTDALGQAKPTVERYEVAIWEVHS